jgi:hypothetical protein
MTNCLINTLFSILKYKLIVLLLLSTFIVHAVQFTCGPVGTVHTSITKPLIPGAEIQLADP